MNIVWDYYIKIIGISQIVQTSYLDMEPQFFVLRSQFATSSLEKDTYGGRRYVPYVFYWTRNCNAFGSTKEWNCSTSKYKHIAKTNKFHDRFIILDNKELYHCGASLKDLGKKCFAISKIEDKDYLNRFSEMLGG